MDQVGEQRNAERSGIDDGLKESRQSEDDEAYGDRANAGLRAEMDRSTRPWAWPCACSLASAPRAWERCGLTPSSGPPRESRRGPHSRERVDGSPRLDQVLLEATPEGIDAAEVGQSLADAE